MAKATKSLSGASQTKYFRDLFGAEPGLSEASADHLLAVTEREIAHVRVRLPVPKRAKSTVAGDVPPAAAQFKDRAATDPVPGSPANAGFDPFAFSVIVILSKDGREGLEARLADIARPEDLLTLAKAQHIGLPEGLNDAAVIRRAIVTGAERRLANRKAAAS
jgi:hypothetical protein